MLIRAAACCFTSLALLPAVGGGSSGAAPGVVSELRAERLPDATIRWSWLPVPGAGSYDLIGNTLAVGNVSLAACRNPEDPDLADTSFDDAFPPSPGPGEYLLVRALDADTGSPGSYASGFGLESRFNTECDPTEAYFCVFDATGDSFVLKLTEADDVAHARAVIYGQEQKLVHVGATSMGGRVPWNPGWQFHIPPPAVYFFSNALEICDASIAGVDQGGPPRGSWCPWTSEIVGELEQPQYWAGGTPEPFYCGPAARGARRFRQTRAGSRGSL